MGLRQPSHGILRMTPVRTAAHVSLATLAALMVVLLAAQTGLAPSSAVLLQAAERLNR